MTVKQLEKLIEKEKKELRKASQKRADLGPKVSRARITSANARYARCAEYVVRLESKLETLKEREAN